MGRFLRNTSNTGSTNVHIFIDESGNVTQIEKKSKVRLKYYIDERLPQPFEEPPCYIGVSGENGRADCSLGIVLGLGDDTYGVAVYDK